MPKAGLLKDPEWGQPHPSSPWGARGWGGIFPSRSWYPPTCPPPCPPRGGAAPGRPVAPGEQLAGWGGAQAQGWGLSECRQRGPRGLERRKRPRQRSDNTDSGVGRAGRAEERGVQAPVSLRGPQARSSPGRKRTFHTLAWRDLQPGAVMVAASGRHPPWSPAR